VAAAVATGLVTIRRVVIFHQLASPPAGVAMG